jgi:hypothetical protein
MAQGMEFRWMGGHPNEDELVRMEAARQDAQDLAQLQKANANATRAYDWMALGEQLGTSGAYQEAMAKQAAQEAEKAADMKRIQELQEKIEAKKARMREDPRMQVAAMMAMGGQPGALQSLLVSSVQQDMQKAEKAAALKKDAQSKMDALENSINTDLMYLAGTNQDQIDRALSVSLPLFKAKLQELTDAGATSRMGGWPAWKQRIELFQQKGQTKKTNAKKSKEKKEQEGNAVFTPR